MDGIDKRRFPRVTHAFLVRYRIPTSKGMVSRMAPVHDLSRGGARFTCEGVFEVGKQVDLQLVLPTTKHPLRIAAHVVWSKVTQRALNLTEYGVAFDVIEAGGEKLLDAALRPLL